MTAFEDLQARHEELLRLQGQEVEILEDVQAYIKQARDHSSQVTGGQEREQLRANLRYWSGYVYERSGTYPNTELAPAQETVPKSRISFPWWVWLIGLFIVVIIIVIALNLPGEPTPEATSPAAILTSTPSPTVELEDTADISGTAIAAVAATLTAQPADTPLPHTQTPTASPTFAVTPSPSSTPALDLGSISVQLLSLQNDDFVRPREVISGTYRNLRPNWSIHALLQPVSGGNRTWFPAEDFFTVPDNTKFSGEWSIEVSFGEGQELENPEQYRLIVVVANNRAAQELLNAAVDTGFDEIPGSLLAFPPPIELFRKAFVTIDEVRLIYASRRLETASTEIVTTRPDGSDLRFLTRTQDIDEFAPSVSPSGEQIAFVQRTRTGLADPMFHFALAIMDSDGQNQKLVTEPGDINYEFPAWSPDGNQLAYGADIPDETGRRIHQIWVYDLDTGENTRLTDSATASRHPAWLPVGNELAFETLGQVGSLSIFALDTETGGIRPLVDTEAQEATPSISSDGARMAYLYYTDPSAEGNRDIYLYDFLTGDSVRLTVHGGLDWRPSIHPDGDTVFFETQRETMIPTIWAVEADGSNVRRVSFNESSDTSPYVGLLKAFLLLESQ